MPDYAGQTYEQLIASGDERRARQQADQQAFDSLNDLERAALSYLRMTPAQFLEWKAKRANDGN